MDFDNMPSNSKKARDEKTIPQNKNRSEKIISGNANKVQKTGFKKVLNQFIAEDLHKISQYFIYDILLPITKRAVSDICSQGLDTLFWGSEVKPRSRSNRNTSKVLGSYRKYYEDDDRRDGPIAHRPYTPTYAYDEIEVDSERDASLVLERLEDVIDMYGSVTVGELYEFVGISNGSYTDYDYGWTNITHAKAQLSRNGRWRILLPEPVPLPKSRHIG